MLSYEMLIIAIAVSGISIYFALAIYNCWFPFGD